MVSASIARGTAIRDIYQRIRHAFDREMAGPIAAGQSQPLTAAAARAFYARIQRRVQLGQRIQQGQRPPRPQNMPRCPELNSGGPPQCHATVFITFLDEDGNECSRQPIYLDYDCAYGPTEIIDLAVREASIAIIGNDTIASDSLNSTSARNCTPDADDAIIGEVCYG